MCVFLGCDMPMVLRRSPLDPTNVYTVVGDSFVHGLNDAIALLGPLPSPWRVRAFQDCTGEYGQYRFHNPDTDTLVDEDPRLGPLDEKWVPVERERTVDDPCTFRCFVDRETGNEINHDPRMSPEALRARGVDIQTFYLV